MGHLRDPICFRLEELGQVLRLIRETGGMGEQMAQGDVFPPVTGELRQHRADLRAEGEQTVFDEGHDHRGGIELGNGRQRPEGLFGGGGAGPGLAGEIARKPAAPRWQSRHRPQGRAPAR